MKCPVLTFLVAMLTSCSATGDPKPESLPSFEFFYNRIRSIDLDFRAYADRAEKLRSAHFEAYFEAGPKRLFTIVLEDRPDRALAAIIVLAGARNTAEMGNIYETFQQMNVDRRLADSQLPAHLIPAAQQLGISPYERKPE